MTVWVLIAFLTHQTTTYSGGPLVIDNIASQAACEHMAEGLRKSMPRNVTGPVVCMGKTAAKEPRE